MSDYKVIKSVEQYAQYCDELERLTSLEKLSGEVRDNIELLTVLIEKWDEENYISKDIHPVEMLRTLMDMHDINSIELSKRTGINKTVISKILNYKKGFSKEVIRVFSKYFKVNQAAFNKPYPLEDAPAEIDDKIKSSI